VERVQRRHLLASINDAKTFRRTTAKVMQEREQLREKKRLNLAKKLEENGLVGQKLGKHKVHASDIEVQLGENLSENLRGLKVSSESFDIIVVICSYNSQDRRQFIPRSFSKPPTKSSC